MIDRRTVVVGMGCLAIPLLVGAQAGPKVRRIGLLTVDDLPTSQRDDFRAAFAERGWVEGANLHVESRSASGKIPRLRALAAELVKLDVELIMGVGTIASQAAKAATARIPVVIYGAGDPVGSGLAASLARPGGNVTGTTLLSQDVAVKRLEVLRELLPAGARVGMLVNPANPAARATREAEEKACKALELQPIHVEAASEAQLEAAVAEVARRGGRVLIVSTDPLFAANSQRVMVAARRVQLPLMSGGDFADAEDILVAFSPDWDELNRRLASYVDRILKGAKPGTLAIEQPSRFRLSINLRTAKKLGIAVPPSLLLRADHVFQ